MCHVTSCDLSITQSLLVQLAPKECLLIHNDLHPDAGKLRNVIGRSNILITEKKRSAFTLDHEQSVLVDADGISDPSFMWLPWLMPKLHCLGFKSLLGWEFLCLTSSAVWGDRDQLPPLQE